MSHKERNQPHSSIELKPSKIKGVGVYALRDITQWTVIGKEDNYVKNSFYRWYSWNDYKTFVSPTKKKVKDFCIGQPDGFWAPVDFDLIPTTWYTNHCCDGNIGFNKRGDWVAIKRIKKGEEVCYDYGIAESNPKFRLMCRCGKKKCRKVITGNDWKNSVFAQKNFNIMYPAVRLLVKSRRD